ncbi:hypothetical protein PPYR_10193 [Photinus pyralis]|uniref:Uncharacterized protein n=2 Tax=Photinus pyralis TaxID=7054 RepID=A0A1Y1LFV7_PHOPY|nr:uncharacterized protein LOC116173436 [Photinus pyralis]XP_031346779.1 uncharacterized protein LOC116173436 [Photinus pyralis]KAB0796132.1 hypothetical protein PPYR_10193 [Photinus pyralis]
MSVQDENESLDFREEVIFSSDIDESVYIDPEGRTEDLPKSPEVDPSPSTPISKSPSAVLREIPKTAFGKMEDCLEDDLTCFGKFIVALLRKLPDMDALKCQNQIYNILSSQKLSILKKELSEAQPPPETSPVGSHHELSAYSITEY